MDTNTNILLTWHAPSHPEHVRSERWYLVSGLLCAIMIGYGILSGAWSLSLVFGLLPALFFLTRNQRNKDHVIRILDTGIEFDGVVSMWSEWNEFWMLQGHDYFELHVARQKGGLKPDLVILTADVDPYKIRDVLSQFIPQSPTQKERLLDAFIRFCKL